jgi:hypothetical protein
MLTRGSCLTKKRKFCRGLFLRSLSPYTFHLSMNYGGVSRLRENYAGA